LSRLTTTTLRHIQIYPRLLKCVQCSIFFRQAFDRANLLADGYRGGGNAGTDWRSIKENGTSTALCNTTPELGSDQT
jgi:hypothetical protein